MEHPAICPEAERLNQQGETMFSEQRYQEALEAFQFAHQLQPDWVVPLNNRGVVLWQAGEYALALTEMMKAYRLDPFHPETVQNLIDMTVALGKRDTAFTIIRTYLRKYPDDQRFMDKMREIRPEIRIVHHMARSGGTIISKCLGCMDDVLLVSEIHPEGSRWFDPVLQCHQWFGMFDPEEIRNGSLTNMPFLEKIARIYEKAYAQKRTLIIRDWTHLDFTAVPFVKNPTYQLTTAMVLQEWFDVLHVATVRHPIDQWLSLRNLSIMKDQLTIDDFLLGYRKFAEKACEIGFIRYEDFTLNPSQAMKTLCDQLCVAYDNGFLQKWYLYTTITGDTNNQRVPKTSIEAVPRRPMEPSLKKEFEASKDYWASIEMLGYELGSVDNTGQQKFMLPF